MLLFSGRHYKVHARFVRRGGPTVVCFDGWTPAPSLDGAPFGLDFLAAQNINVVAVRAGANDWYQNAEIEEVAHVVRGSTLGDEVVGYGSSMGAYAVLSFLQCTHCLLFSPQFSLDPQKVPWESRWAGERAAIPSWSWDFVGGRSLTGIVAFDPRDSLDCAHVDLISRTHRLQRLELPGSGHACLNWLSLRGCVSEVVTGLLLRRLEIADALAIIGREESSSSR